ncbi:phage minor head protein [Enterobacter hormaechei]|nr:phage minor head protein [Enterobacter hormaechei]
MLKHVPLQSIAPEQVYASAVAQPFQGRLLKEWGQKLESDRLDKITSAVRTGFLQGETVEQIVKRVAGTPQLNRQDGVINASRRDLAVVARTAVNHMAATARQEFAQANSDIVKAKQWSSTLDTHTSQWCIIRDRKLYSLDGKPLGHAIPYLRGPGKIHFCCRSCEILITKSWEELQIASGELSSATRASMSGQIPAGLSFSEWLVRQPYARQEQVLGVTRARMLRDGKITVPDMFNDRGEFLTLDELRRIDAAAFE